MKRTIGDRSRIIEHVRRRAACFHRSLSQRELYLDRGQGLADLGVQVTRDDTTLLLLRGDQTGRQTLAIARVLDLLQPLAVDSLFKAADVAGRQQGDRKADENRNTE